MQVRALSFRADAALVAKTRLLVKQAGLRRFDYIRETAHTKRKPPEGGTMDAGTQALKRFQHLQRFRMLLDELDQHGRLGVRFGGALFPVLVGAHIDAQPTCHDSL